MQWTMDRDTLHAETGAIRETFSKDGHLLKATFRASHYRRREARRSCSPILTHSSQIREPFASRPASRTIPKTTRSRTERNHPGLDFLRAVPKVWDETRVLDGKVIAHMVMARHRGKEWFVDGITGDERP